MLALDVTDAQSIQQALEAARPIDALVNNAGFGAAAPFECTPMATARQLLETNALGTMALTQAVLPQFRQLRGRGRRQRELQRDAEAAALLAAYRASRRR